MSYQAEKLVIDRSISDVNEARNLITKICEVGIDRLPVKERNKFLSGLRGAYNASDLNRVEETIQYITVLLNLYGYNIKIPYRHWEKMSDGELVYPTVDELWEMVGKVNRLLDTVTEFIELDRIPILQDAILRMTYSTANAIEQNLKLLCESLEALVSPIWICSGTSYSGYIFHFTY